MGYYDAESVSSSGSGITIFSMKGVGHTDSAERPTRMTREERIEAALAMLREEGVEIREEAPNVEPIAPHSSESSEA